MRPDCQDTEWTTPSASDVWDLLAHATRERTGFTAGFLATVDPDEQPRVRAVILRDADPSAATVSFATDVRSAKIRDIQLRPAVELALYDPERMLQLRLSGTADIVADPEIRAKRWADLAPHTRERFEQMENFAWVAISVTSCDWLDLAAEPPRRFRMTVAPGQHETREITP